MEEYIAKNKHLVGVPTQKQVKENGIDLGNNQALLLQKIEWLTLYLIDQNKKMESLQKRVQELENARSK